MEDSNSMAVFTEETKSKNFNKEFTTLARQLKEVLYSKYGEGSIANNKVEMICLNRYLGIYSQSRPDEHYEFFEKVYHRNRAAILNCLKNDQWLKNNLSIRFAEGYKDMEQDCRQMVIMVSSFYRTACELRDNMEKDLDTLGNTSDKDAIDLSRPLIITLHLVRIFYYLNEGSDHDTLGDIVTKLEDQLGVTNHIHQKKVAPADPSKVIGNLLKSGGQFLEKMGFQIPDDIKSKLSNPEDLTKNLGSVVSALGEAAGKANVKTAETAEGKEELTSEVKTSEDKPAEDKSADAVGALFDLTVNAMESFGFKAPNLKRPTDKDISSVITGVLSDDRVKNLVNQVSTSIQQKEEKNKLDKTLETITEPENVEALTEAVSNVTGPSAMSEE